MTEYKVLAKEVGSVIWRDVEKAAQELGAEVTRMMVDGWEAHGGIASVQAGTGVHLLQAVVKR